VDQKKIIIIGSGFGGLAAGIRLAAQGHIVTIFEKLDKPGGRAYVFETGGFKFDAGPTVITAPFMIDDLFELAGRRRQDYVTFVECDPFYRIFNHEGQAFDYNRDESFILEQISRWNPSDGPGYQRFMDTTEQIFNKGFVELADQPFLHATDMVRVAPDLIRLQSYRSVYSYVSQFVEDEFLRRCFSFHPLLIGGNPFDAPSIYALIHYLEGKWGVHYAMGGTGTLVLALVKLFEELGGEIYLNSPVREILVENDQVTGVALDNLQIHAADVVVSNADVAYTYRNMIPETFRRKYTNRKIDRMKYSMSLFVWYFGTKRRYTDRGLAHHNIILGPRYRDLLNDIFNRKVLVDDFSLYLHMPTITDPSVAPDGHEAFYVLAPVPNLASDVDWKTTAPRYRQALLGYLEKNYLPDLSENIVAEHYIDPLHFQNTLNSHLGSAFSFQPVLTQSAWFRPHNRSEDFRNLYFVGAGTHPGAGIPGVLSSAKIAADLIN
jgi:phytoene desaturase